MKRAWVSVVEWEGRQIGQIERLSEVEDWPIYCVNNGWVEAVDFDETNIASGYEVAELVPEHWSKEYEDDVFVDPQDESWAYHESYWHIIEDTARKEADAVTNLENRKYKWEEACVNGGHDCRVHFNRLLTKYEYGDDALTFFMTDSDFQTVDFLLERGALNKSIDLLTAKEIGTYYTQEFKDEYISIVTNISNAIGNEPV